MKARATMNHAQLDAAISEYIRDTSDGQIITEWVLVTTAIIAGGEPGERAYRVVNAEGMPLHSINGLLAIAPDVILESSYMPEDDD